MGLPNVQKIAVHNTKIVKCNFFALNCAIIGSICNLLSAEYLWRGKYEISDNLCASFQHYGHYEPTPQAFVWCM